MYFIWPDGDAQAPLLVAFLKFWSFIIIFTNFVPISLLVTLDMVKLFQSRLIAWDREMYHVARDFDGSKRPMPAEVCVSMMSERGPARCGGGGSGAGGGGGGGEGWREIYFRSTSGMGRESRPSPLTVLHAKDMDID